VICILFFFTRIGTHTLFSNAFTFILLADAFIQIDLQIYVRDRTPHIGVKCLAQGHICFTH